MAQRNKLDANRNYTHTLQGHMLLRWEQIPAVRDFFTRLYGRAETHASVEDIHGYLLVRENF